MRRIGSIFLALLLVGAWLLVERGEAPRTIRAEGGAPVHVIDGDSLRIGAEEIRIAGIDAPEYRQMCGDGQGGEWPCGKAARDELVRIAEAGSLACTARARDRHGRTLADCRTGAGDIADAMARAGLALGAGDGRFDGREAEIAEARAARRGIWRGPHLHPADWRRAEAEAARRNRPAAPAVAEP